MTLYELTYMLYKLMLTSNLTQNKDRDSRLKQVLEFTKCQGCKIFLGTLGRAVKPNFFTATFM